MRSGKKAAKGRGLFRGSKEGKKGGATQKKEKASIREKRVKALSSIKNSSSGDEKIRIRKKRESDHVNEFRLGGGHCQMRGRRELM